MNPSIRSGFNVPEIVTVTVLVAAVTLLIGFSTTNVSSTSENSTSDFEKQQYVQAAIDLYFELQGQFPGQDQNLCHDIAEFLPQEFVNSPEYGELKGQIRYVTVSQLQNGNGQAQPSDQLWSYNAETGEFSRCR